MNFNKYINNSGSTQHYLLPSEDKTRVTSISLVPNGTIILGYPGLDNYVPHLLAKITENGEDLSHKVVRERETTVAKKRDFVVEPELLVTEQNSVVAVEDSVEEVAELVEVTQIPVKSKLKNKIGKK